MYRDKREKALQAGRAVSGVPRKVGKVGSYWRTGEQKDQKMKGKEVWGRGVWMYMW